MSSFVRTLEKRTLKGRGFRRLLSEVRQSVSGAPYIHVFPKGKGPIVNSDGKKVGQHYPRATA